ncbi:MAG: GNAT family N-acetyltransferase [Kiritimatiellae bacterium]|nr:GNAT family N-acetyltransferase [Kiritimatiellia bacterium]
MPDMLVKLYDLKDDWGFLQAQEQIGITIRKPIGAEKHALVAWVREHFSDAWASETDVALSSVPKTCFVAVQERKFVGFSCYDAAALGFFGPIGVDKDERGKGTGKALLLACMLDMKLKGYGYAVIGMTNLLDFYGHCVGAVPIEDSTPSIWKTWVKRE